MTERTHKLLSKRYVPKWLKLILIPTLSFDEADLVITEDKNRPCSSILASKKGNEKAVGFHYFDPNITHFVILGVYDKEKMLKDWKPIIQEKMSKKRFYEKLFSSE